MFKIPSIGMSKRRERRRRSVIKVRILHERQGAKPGELRGDRWKTTTAIAQNSNTAVGQASPHAGGLMLRELTLDEDDDDGGW